MAQKLYTEMTADEQLQWIKSFTDFMNGRLDKLVQKRIAWEQDDREEMKAALKLIAVWPFAIDFVDNALRYGDFEARA